MKSLSVKLGVILFGLAIFGCAEVWGVDWKHYFVTEEDLFFFDASSITHSSKNVIRVWVRQKLTEKGVIDYVGLFGKAYENLNHSICLWEINCLEKMRRLVSWTDYDNKGGAIYSDSSLTKLFFIIPESVGENLYKEVCK